MIDGKRQARRAIARPTEPHNSPCSQSRNRVRESGWQPFVKFFVHLYTAAS